MSKRLKQIVDTLSIKPDQYILEIGCGQGVAGTYVCEKLTTGRYVGIDRSEKMIKVAEKRNQQYVVSGKAAFMQQDLERLDLGDLQLDAIFAVRVRLFYTQREKAEKLIQKYLKPNGKLTVIYDPPN